MRYQRTPRRRSRSGRALTPEGATLRQITDGLSAHSIPYERLNSGAQTIAATSTAARRHIRFGFRGCPDLIVFLPGPFGGLGFIEVKSPVGRLSPPQVLFRALCIKHRVPHCTARSWADVEAWLKEL